MINPSRLRTTCGRPVFMRTFEISDQYTISDIGLELTADSLAELYIAGAEGMFAIIFGRRIPRGKSAPVEIEVRADTPEQLLVDWLSELLYNFDAKGLIPVEYHLDTTSNDRGTALAARVGCCRYDREKDEAEHEIKAVTYYKLKIKRSNGIYRCHVVFDL